VAPPLEPLEPALLPPIPDVAPPLPPVAVAPPAPASLFEDELLHASAEKIAARTAALRPLKRNAALTFIDGISIDS
jgi:hypothetical protein